MGVGLPQLCAECSDILTPAEGEAVIITQYPAIPSSYLPPVPPPEELPPVTSSLEESRIIEMRNLWLGCNETHLK